MRNTLYECVHTRARARLAWKIFMDVHQAAKEKETNRADGAWILLSVGSPFLFIFNAAVASLFDHADDVACSL